MSDCVSHVRDLRRMDITKMDITNFDVDDQDKLLQLIAFVMRGSIVGNSENPLLGL